MARLGIALKRHSTRRSAMQSRLVVAALAGLSAVAIFVPMVEAANRFGLTCIQNKTNIPLTYEFRWGNNGQWSARTVRPNERRAHSWRYDKPDENRSPTMFVRFDSDLSKRMINQSYRLDSYASPQETDCRRYGKEYVFRFDGSAKKYIDLKAVRE
jgi:hypothetical protein